MADGFRDHRGKAETLPFDLATVERAFRSGVLRDTSAALRRAGLEPVALRRGLGLRYPSRPEIEGLVGPASFRRARDAWLWLLVAGVAQPRARFRDVSFRHADLLDQLERLGFVAGDRGCIAPRVSILPVGDQLLVCDPPTAPGGRWVVAAPDLSAFHLIDQLGGRRPRSWLDLATGTGVIGLAGRRRDGGCVLGTDLNPRAVSFARVSGWLNGHNDVAWRAGDLFAPAGRPRGFERITFNPPLVELAPDDPEADLPLYMAGAAGLIERFWREVPQWIEADGEVVVHTALPEDPDFPRSLGLPGSFRVGVFQLGPRDRFAITRWRPGGPRGVRFEPLAGGERPRFGRA